MFIAFLPLLLLIGNAVYWHVGMPQPGRAAEVVLALGALAALVVFWRRRLPASLAVGGWRKHLALPWTWLLGALAWSLVTLVWAGPQASLGCIVLAERGAALVVALGVATWLAGRDSVAVRRALPFCGAVLLLMAAISGIPMGTRGDGQGALHLGNLLLLTTASPSRVLEQPFGLNNFNLGAAAPLLAVGLGALVATGRRGARDLVMLAGAVLGLVALVIVGLGLGTDHRLLAAWYTLAVMAVAAVALCLPRRLAPWAYLAVILVPLILLLGVVFSERLPEMASRPSLIWRVGTWIAARDAVAASPLIGHGTGAASVAMCAETSYNLAWLAVPSFPEHAHNEILQLLLEGGAVLVLLLLPAVWWTIRPLWMRRHEPLAAGLLVGWAVALTLLLVESHLSQPGPLLCLALLAGVSWTVPARPVGAPAVAVDLLPREASADRLRRSAPGLVGILPVLPLVLLVVAGIAWTMVRSRNRQGPAGIDCAYSQQGLQDASAGQVAERLLGLRDRIGPVDDFEVGIVDALAHSEDPRRREAALDLALEIGQRLPAHPYNLELLIRLDHGRQDLRVQVVMDAAQRMVAHPLLHTLRFPDRQSLMDHGARRERINQMLNIWDQLKKVQRDRRQD